MFKLLLSVLLVFFVVAAQAQELIKSYVKNNTVRVKTIEPDSTDYTDLESLGAAIGEAKLVMLGEQEHGDATTFLAKSRLVKYLHEKKGFNVLAFESDFFGMTAGWDSLAKTKTAIDSFMFHNPFPIWSWCNTCSNLFYNYIPATYNTGNPLQIAGFDCQLHGVYTEKNYIARLTEILNKIKTAEPAYATIIAQTILCADSLILSYGNTHNKDSVSTNKSIAFLNNLLQSSSKNLLSLFEVQVLKNAIAELSSSKLRNGAIKPQHYYRDKQMADNIEWLCQVKYPNEKIIVWAHNAHIAKSNGSSSSPINEFSMMGYYLSKTSVLKDKIYVLGFTSHTGFSQWASVNPKNNHAVQKPAKNSFENWVPGSYEYAFTDFKPFNAQNPAVNIAFSMKGSLNQPHSNYVHYWTNIFDGVFFVRRMYGCENIKEK